MTLLSLLMQLKLGRVFPWEINIYKWKNKIECLCHLTFKGEGVWAWFEKCKQDY